MHDADATIVFICLRVDISLMQQLDVFISQMLTAWHVNFIIVLIFLIQTTGLPSFTVTLQSPEI